MGKAIPDRWLPYSSLGKVIEGTRFICFKVPLKKAVLEMSKKQGLEIDDMWDLETLLKRVPKLKYVIDLTNTSRYYEPRELEAAGVEHVKISMPGRVIPPEPVVKVFIDTVERFLRRGDGDDTLIGVHCTHGLNRTGYMICRYLKDRLGMAPDKAIEMFESARGYKIERENYLAGIHGTELPPPDFGDNTILQSVQHPDRHDNTRNYGNRERYVKHGNYNDDHYGNDRSGESEISERPSRYGRTWRGRDRTRSRSRDRSPARERRYESDHSRDTRQGSDCRSRDNVRRPAKLNGRFRGHSNESDSSNASDFDFRYDY